MAAFIDVKCYSLNLTIKNEGANVERLEGLGFEKHVKFEQEMNMLNWRIGQQKSQLEKLKLANIIKKIRL
jgi:hypothetical protein